MHIKQKRQYITLSQEGIITYSCDSIFSSKAFNQRKVVDFISIFSGMFCHLKEALKHQKTLTLKAVNEPAKALPGIYDFIFSTKKNKNNPSQTLIEWWIIERTDYYIDLRKYQQVSQESIISNETRDL